MSFYTHVKLYPLDAGAFDLPTLGPQIDALLADAGAPVSAYAGFEREHTFRSAANHTEDFAHRRWVLRGFCGECGSTISYEGDRWPSEVHLHVGIIDDPERFAPSGESFVEERLTWLKLSVP